MYQFLGILILSFTAAAHANANPNCTLRFDNVQAQIRETGELRSYQRNVDLASQLQTEVATLMDGTQVTATYGGCAHLGITFSYKTTFVPANAKEALLVTLEYLKKTPVTQFGKPVYTFLTDNMRRAIRDNSGVDNGAGRVDISHESDAQMAVDYSVQGEVKAEYSFAL